MISEENLVTKYMYKSNPNFKGEDNKFENIDLIYVVEYFPKDKLFIISDEVGNKHIATVDDIFKNFTSIKPLYVISVKKGKKCDGEEDVYGLVINPYFSEWSDASKMPYTYGLELNLSNIMGNKVAINENTKLDDYTFMMYNRLDSDKTPKYDNLETVTVVYGYYNSDVTKLLARIFTNPKLPYTNYLNIVEEARGYVYWYLKEMHGVQIIDREMFIKLERVISKSGPYRSTNVKLNDTIKNICNIPLNFQYIDGATSILEKYDLSMDIEKIKKEYGPYNIVILKVIEFRNGKFGNELSTYIGVLNYKSNISGEVEFGLDNSEISKLLDFNKG